MEWDNFAFGVALWDLEVWDSACTMRVKCIGWSLRWLRRKQPRGLINL